MSTATRQASWTIRPGAAGDYPDIGRLYEAVYGVGRSPTSLTWLYDANPAGRCRLWVAEDIRTGRIVGTRPVFPWRLRVGERELTVGQAGDAMTHPEFQGRGIFTELVKVAWSALHDQGVPFTFSFSNPGSLSVYKKLIIGSARNAGTHEVLHFRRLVRPLVPSSILGQPSRVPGLEYVDRVVNALQRSILRLPRGMSVFTVQRFDAEFDALWIRLGGRHRLLTVRDAKYLNWRYQDGTARFQTLGLRRRDELVGYVTFQIDGEGNGWIADVFGPPEPYFITNLLRAAVRSVAASGGRTVSIWAAVESRIFAVIRRAGFIPRGQSYPMAVHVYGGSAEGDAALESQGWWAWYGDRDVEGLVTEPRCER